MKIKSTVMKKIFSLFVFCMGFLAPIIAQDSTQTEKPQAPKQKFARATFNATKLINMQTTEIVNPGALQFMISHHFGYLWNKDLGEKDGRFINQRFRQNLANFFGLNSGIANTYLSFDYSPVKWGNVGIAATGRAGFEGWTKFKLLRQQTGIKNYPVSVSLFSLANVSAAKKVSDSEFVNNRWSFMNQLLIARKFSEKLSIQLAPTWIHYNLVPYGINNSNEIFSMGIGGKYKLKSTLNLTFEYARQFNMYENIIDKNGNIINYDPDLFSAGIEINTGGHLFQFYVGNTTAASNIEQLSRNTSDGKVAMGFTINRSLNVRKDK
jgi:hypothetical protein